METSWATIIIGGEIDDDGIKKVAKALSNLIREDSVSVEDAKADLWACSAAEETSDWEGEIAYGNPDDLVTVLDDLGLSYRITCASGSGYSAEILTGIPRLGISARHEANEAGDPVLSLRELERAQSNGVTLDAVIRELEVHDKPIPALRMKTSSQTPGETP